MPNSDLDEELRNGCFYVIAKETGGWQKASEAQKNTYRKIQANYHGFQFYLLEEGVTDGCAYKINANGVWLKIEGKFLEIREIEPPLESP